MLIGAIEAGGTKFVCAIGTKQGEILDKTVIPTTDPQSTLKRVISYFQSKPIKSLGVGSFGPICLNPAKKNYGVILNTPKTGWRNYPLYKSLKEALNIPVHIDTDVNVAALAEYTYGQYDRVKNLLYITIGTGIGAGLIHKGEIFLGKHHPEMGHIFVPKSPDDEFLGTCPFHENCLEGLASGTAINKRTGIKGEDIPENHYVWNIVSHYIAHAIVNYSYILSPDIIVLGGGVMKQHHLYSTIRDKAISLLNNYTKIQNMDCYIVPANLKNEQGIKGAICLSVNKTN